MLVFKEIIEETIVFDGIVEEEIIEDINEINEILEDIDEIIEMDESPEWFITEDKGETYTVYDIYEEKGVTVIKSLESQRFGVIATLFRFFGDVISGDLYPCLDRDPETISLRDEWVRFWPNIVNVYYWPQIRIKEVPKRIRKEFLKNPNEIKLEFIEICLTNGISEEKIISKMNDKDFTTDFVCAQSLEIPWYVFEEFSHKRLKDAIVIALEKITLPFGIDPFLKENEKNMEYCSILKTEKIPYEEFFEDNGYTIISPKSSMDFYEESKIMHNCVASPHQEHVESVLEGKQQVYFLREGNRHVATIGVVNNVIVECLGKYNTSCEERKDGKIFFTQEESEIVDKWAKRRGIIPNY